MTLASYTPSSTATPSHLPSPHSQALSSIKQMNRGILVLLLLLVSAFFTCHFLLFPALPFLFIPIQAVRRFYRYWVSWAAALWLTFGAFLIESIGWVKICIAGDELPSAKTERALLMSNHPTRLDWIYYWNLAVRARCITSYRVILKSSLRAFPWWGWGMSQNIFAFITRGGSANRSQSTERIHSICTYLGQLECPNALIIFPEGTDLSTSNKEKDKTYCLQKNLKPYEYVLHPRSGAFVTSIKAMREKQLDCLYDFTIAYRAYKPGERPSEVSVFLQGRWPKEVHIHIKRHDIKSFASMSEPELDTFIQKSFEKKEELLRSFYQNGCSFDKGGAAAGPYREGNKVYLGLVYTFSCILLSLVTIGVIALAKRYTLGFCIYVLVGIMVYTGVTKFFDGFDNVELAIPTFLYSEKKTK